MQLNTVYVAVSADMLGEDTIASLLVTFLTPKKQSTDAMERALTKTSHCLCQTNMTAIYTISSPICVVSMVTRNPMTINLFAAGHKFWVTKSASAFG